MRDAKLESAEALRPGVRSGASALPRARVGGVGPMPPRSAGMPGLTARPARSMAITLNRMLGLVESRIVTVLSQAEAPNERQEARLELGLLVRIRNGLQGQPGASEDAVLAESLVEFAEAVQQTLADLEAGGARRVRRLLEFDRELLAELAAFGGSAAPHKAAWQKARDMLKQDQDNAAYVQHATREALTLYTRLTGELDRCCPRSRGTLLDDMLRP